ncbi:MAG TPA: hypothetical protein VIO94_00790 [Phenylobacterium sp.]
MRWLSLLAATAVLAAPGGLAAQAPVDPGRDDVRCLLVAVKASQQPENETQALIGALYFIGKLDGRNPQFDLEKVALTELRTMNEATTKSESVRCMREMRARGAKLRALGESIRARGREIPS